MPYRLDTHVLTVDANVIHKVDTGNPANLYSMWTVFSRCADSVEQGRRLENLSWRLWQRAQLIEKEAQTTQTNHQPPATLSHNIPSEPRTPEIPQLSGSVESVLEDEEAVEFSSVSTPLEISRPRIWRQDSSVSSRSRRDRHITSDDFEKMVVSIVQDKAPLSAPTQTSTVMPSLQKLPATTATGGRSGSTSSESHSPTKSSEGHVTQSDSSATDVKPRQTTVVRGFSPSQVPVPQTLPTITAPLDSQDCIPEPKAAPAAKVVPHKQKPSFALGASCSSSEVSQSLDMAPKGLALPAAKKPIFQIGGSSEEEGSLKSAMHSSRGSLLKSNKKQASFSEHVSTIPQPDDEAAIDSDTDYIDESAIDDDDDSSDWEDSIEDSGKSSMDDKFFQRVDSKANLTSRPSLITLMLAQNDRAKNLGGQTSQSTSAINRSRAPHTGATLGVSPNDSDEAPLMMKGACAPSLKPIIEAPRSNAQPIPAAPVRAHAQAALSPRTTRRNMLSTELTESLRRHLLWERQQKSSTANAVLKRRHTSHDVANLKQYPDKACMKEQNDGKTWNQYFNKDTLNGYHSKGW